LNVTEADIARLFDALADLLESNEINPQRCAQ
jgi:hypothetical protein